jgi:predicted adenine nucleotide alpha hydrolase (AANH) superfamily ATPase
MTKPKLLLHLCCGPCGTAVIERLSRDYDVTPFWFNPNIQPDEEYALRLEAALKLAAELQMALPQDHTGKNEFVELARGLEDLPEGGERCLRCFELRLRRAMEYAREHDFTHVAATLSISPHKRAEDINAVGERLAKESGLVFVAEDFKSDGGFARSVVLSRQYGLYRQKYCGCFYSIRHKA